MGKPRQVITQATFNRICREIASGKSLRKALKGKGMPGMYRFYDYLEREPARAEQYARARRQCMECHIDGIVELADTATPENAHAVRLMVDTRKWIASKILPRIYGDYQQIDLRATHSLDLGEQLRRAREREIKGLSTAALPAAAPAGVIDVPTMSVPALPDGFVEEEQE